MGRGEKGGASVVRASHRSDRVPRGSNGNDAFRDSQTREVAMKKVMIVAALAVAVLAGGALGYRFGRAGRRPVAAEGASRTGALYHCPMHPQIVSDKPGQCPICQMTLVKSVDEPRAKRSFYRSTMNPEEISDHPGNDSMGMAMVPEEVEEPSSATGPQVEGL